MVPVKTGEVVEAVAVEAEGGMGVIAAGVEGVSVKVAAWGIAGAAQEVLSTGIVTVLVRTESADAVVEIWSAGDALVWPGSAGVVAVSSFADKTISFAAAPATASAALATTLEILGLEW